MGTNGHHDAQINQAYHDPEEGLQNGEEAEPDDADGADDDLSTTSGRRHGALLLPDPEDYLIFNVSFHSVA